MLAKSELNSIETLVSQALIDMETSHEEHIATLKEKVNMKRRMKIQEVKIKTRNYEIM